MPKVSTEVPIEFLRTCKALPLGPHDTTCVQCRGTDKYPSDLGYAVLDLISWTMQHNPGRIIEKNELPDMNAVIQYASLLRQQQRHEQEGSDS